jgi:hypothetical protein
MSNGAKPQRTTPSSRATVSIPIAIAARSWRLVLLSCVCRRPRTLQSSTYRIKFWQLGLGQGSIRRTVFVVSPDNQVEIDTPNGSLSILSPGSYRVGADPNAGSTLVRVNSSSLQVNATGVTQTVGSGAAVELRVAVPVQILSMSLPAEDEFDQWCDLRFRGFAASSYVNLYIPGVEDLDSTMELRAFQQKLYSAAARIKSRMVFSTVRPSCVRGSISWKCPAPSSSISRTSSPLASAAAKYLRLNSSGTVSSRVP